MSKKESDDLVVKDGHPAVDRDKFLNAVLSALPHLVFYLDRDYRYLYANQAFLQWFGVPADTVMKSTMPELIGEEATNGFRPYIEAAFNGKESVIERDVAYRSGPVRHVQVHYQPDFGADGLVRGVVAIVQDLTESKRAALQLEYERNKLKKLINGIPTMISHWDRSLINKASNALYAGFYGKEPSEIVGHRYDEILGPRFPHMQPRIDAVLAGEAQTFHIELTNAAGVPRRYQVTYHPDRADDEVLGFFTIGMDVTDQHEESFRFEQMANAIGEAFWLSDPFARAIKYVSPGYERIWGRTCASFRSDPRSFFEAVHPEDQFRASSALWNQSAQASNERFRISRSDGALRWIQLRTYPVETGLRGPYLVASVAQDVTDEVVMREVLDQERSRTAHQAKLASLGEMSAGIAHEINNPLAIISGTLAQIDRLRGDPEKFRQKILSMERSVERIAKIVRGLSKFSRISDGLTRRRARLADLVRESTFLTEGKAKRHSVAIELTVDSEAEILCDEVEIEQVIVNLINNAVDAVKSLEARWVRLRVHEAEGEIALTVVDAGSGIPAQLRDRIFDPFFTTKPVGEGTGLGLSITKGILDQHRARIWIDAADAHTRFELRFQRPTAWTAFFS